eukprot:1156526-Pelagomonas_calceolata.AAC.4
MGKEEGEEGREDAFARLDRQAPSCVFSYKGRLSCQCKQPQTVQHWRKKNPPQIHIREYLRRIFWVLMRPEIATILAWSAIGIGLQVKRALNSLDMLEV